MLKPDFAPAFVRGRKRCVKKHWNISELDKALAVVVGRDEEPIPPDFADHGLLGKLKRYRAVHVGGKASNWVVVYRIDGDRVMFISTGTHDEVYND